MATKALSLATLLMNEKNSVRLLSASSQTSSAMRWSGLSGSLRSCSRYWRCLPSQRRCRPDVRCVRQRNISTFCSHSRLAMQRVISAM